MIQLCGCIHSRNVFSLPVLDFLTLFFRVGILCKISRQVSTPGQQNVSPSKRVVHTDSSSTCTPCCASDGTHNTTTGLPLPSSPSDLKNKKKQKKCLFFPLTREASTLCKILRLHAITRTTNVKSRQNDTCSYATISVHCTALYVYEHVYCVLLHSFVPRTTRQLNCPFPSPPTSGPERNNTRLVFPCHISSFFGTGVKMLLFLLLSENAVNDTAAVAAAVCVGVLCHAIRVYYFLQQ